MKPTKATKGSSNRSSQRFRNKSLQTVNSQKEPSSKHKYTPLEQQVLEIKAQHPNTLLFIECGYKYRLFGEDAEIASQELNIGCFPYHNFLSASFPTHRVYVHLRRLVAKGYKVGVVKQRETAALKAVGDNKSALFSRKLQALYTKSTLIAEDQLSQSEDEENKLSTSFSVPGYLMCICESIPTCKKQKEKVNMAVVAIQPATGNVLYTSFEDGPTRSELEDCLIHLQPVEVLVSTSLSPESENLIKNIAALSPTSDDRMRIEQMPDDNFDFSSALITLSEFYKPDNEELIDANTDGVSKVLSLPPLVICCFAVILTYLKDFNLHSVLKHVNTFVPMTCTSQFMHLNASTVRNLELFRNATNNTETGSLMWAINHTETKFGSRLLHSWVSRPLADVRDIKQRQEIITEIVCSSSCIFMSLKKMLQKLPDLESGLCAALYLKCTCINFVLLLKAFICIKENILAMQQQIKAEIQSLALRNLLLEIPSLLDDIDDFLSKLNENAAKKGDKIAIFSDLSSFPTISSRIQDTEVVLKKLTNLCPVIAQQLCIPTFSYSTVSGQEFLIEVSNKQLSLVPHSWTKISTTKQVSRFRSPEVQTLLNELRQLREQLHQDCEDAWLEFLRSFSKNFYFYKKAVLHLSQLDCYFSFAQLAKQDHYCCPKITDKQHRKIYIIRGRHPIVEKLLSDQKQYVANDTNMDSSKNCLILTGPNMGGKSSYIRQVALIVILAQIGSYVPAEEAEISVFDGIYIRMGAADSIHQKKSTFMLELQETAAVLRKATQHSLVMLDELGRGTSTHDGMAVAYATLSHLLTEIKCTTLFITHYPPVTELKKLYPHNILCNHMTYIINNKEASPEESNQLASLTLTFLHQLGEGVSQQSYGVNVGHLAGIPPNLLKMAELKSHEMECLVKQNRILKDLFLKLWHSDLSTVRYNLHHVKDET